MANFHRTPNGDGLAAIPLEAEDHAAIVEVKVGMVRLAVVAPVTNVTATLSRSEAREMALAVLGASQQIEED
jgi:hypothetical protein